MKLGREVRGALAAAVLVMFVPGTLAADEDESADLGYELTCDEGVLAVGERAGGGARRLGNPDWYLFWYGSPDNSQYKARVEDGKLDILRAEEPGYFAVPVLEDLEPQRLGQLWTFRFTAAEVGFENVAAWGGNTPACSLNGVPLPHPHGYDAPATVGAAVVSERPMVMDVLLAEARFYSDRWHHQATARKTSVVLGADPRAFEAHRLFMWAWSYMHGEGIILEQYRASLEEDREDPTRRLLRAMALGSSVRPDPEDCVEIEQLLAPLPTDPDLRYHALRVLLNVHDGACPGDSEADRRRIHDLEHESAAGARWILWGDLRSGRVDAELAARLRERYRHQPWDLGLATWLWADGARGPALRAARRDALTEAREYAGDGRLVVVQAAHDVLLRAGREEEAEALEPRLEALDPFPAWRARVWKKDDLGDEIRQARKMLSSESGLARLDELNSGVPESGPTRAAYEMARVHHLERLERGQEALEARRLAWLAEPDESNRANGFAWKAALAGVHLVEALQAIDQAIASGEAMPYDRTDWDGSADYAQRAERDARRLGAWRDTRAWVLHRLGRHEEAAVEMRRALRLGESSTLQLHMGLIYAALGLDTAAADHLARGFALGERVDPDLERESRRVLEQLVVRTGWWHPGGLEGHLATLRATLDEEQTEPPTADEEPRSTSPHKLVGAPFPDLEVRLRGKRKRTMSDFGGIRVVDIWATWCSPCVAGLPHMDEVARAYADRGVTVLAISVDEEYDDVQAVFEGVDAPAYELAWAPGAMEEASVRGIPAVFVLEPDGTVFDFIQGGGPDDHRVDRAIDRLLEKLEDRVEPAGD